MAGILSRGAAEHKPSATELIDSLRKGLAYEELEALQEGLEVPLNRVAELLDMSKATLQRRRNAGVLTVAESDRVVRYARLLARAVEVMESEEAARAWLGAPQFGLGGEEPLEYARTEVGAREVEDLLGRIDAGVYA